MKLAKALSLPVLLAAGLILAGCSDSTENPPPADAGVDMAKLDKGAQQDGADDGAAEAAAPDKGCVKPDAGAPGACAKNTLEAFKGKYQVVIDTLQMGGVGEGFDLNNADCDNSHKTGVDNVLWVIGALANPSLTDSMKKGEVSIPFEFFDVDSLTSDDCLNFAMYVGRFPPDYDGDGEEAGGGGGRYGKDCNDNDKNIGPKKKEVAGNGVDDDCDGKADEDSSGNPSTDTSDADNDGQTIADGDCDESTTYGKLIKKGAKEICGDGLDNDCNGKADDECLPWSSGMQYPIENLSLDTAGKEGLITFRDAKIVGGRLYAGPSIFGVKLELQKNILIELNLTHVFVEADVKSVSGGMALDKAMLGGVLSARAMDQAPNLLEDYYGEKDDSLLDVLLGPIGANLGLPKDKDDNVVPDVDVDGDGVEKFLDTNTADAAFKVDTCVDGDGTIIKDKVDSSGKVTEPCTMAKDQSGNYRFVDGWSISLKFDASPTKIKGVVQTSTAK